MFTHTEKLPSVRFNKHQSIGLAAAIAACMPLPAASAPAGLQVGTNGNNIEVIGNSHATKPLVVGPENLPILTGFFEKQLIGKVSLHVIRTCDTDGSWCSGATSETVQKAIDFANAAHYRSESKIRFVLSDSTDLQDILYWDMMNNNDCKLRGDYSIVNRIEIGMPAESVVHEWGDMPFDMVVDGVVANGEGIVVKEGDLNGDGVEGDEKDASTLCIAWSDEQLQFKTAFADSIQNDYGAVPVFVQNGHGDVKWDADNKVWLANQSSVTPNSSCAGNQINLRNDMSDGGVLTHESGHYLCTRHTFHGRKGYTKEQAKNIITDFVEGSYVGPLDEELIPLDEGFVLKEIFDADGGVVTVDPQNPKITDFLEHYRIEDTPADPGIAMFEEEYGKTGACAIGNDTVDLEVDFPSYGPYVYTFAPDRRNAMSYFFGCAPMRGYQRFTEDQVDKMVATTFHHREPVTTYETVPTWRNHMPSPIPAADSGTSLKWGRSYIEVYRDGYVGKVTVGVDISHPRGGLKIDLISPDGKILPLESPGSNQNKITGDIRTQFVLYEAGLLEGAKLAAGIWELRVAEQNSVSQGNGGSINEWQIQFDD
jgi:subtilisin-like proprotein convertase family protein